MIERLAHWLVLATGWRRNLAGLCAGLLSAMAMAPFDLFFVLFVTLPIFVWIMDGVYSDAETSEWSRFLGAFAAGWWFGFGYFAAGLWWIGNALLVEAESHAWALPLAVLALPAGIAIFWGLAAAAVRLVWSNGPERVLALAIALGLAEYLRGTILTGFPWNTLGYAALSHPIGFQTASITGVYGLTPLVVVVFAAPVWLVGARRRLSLALLMFAVLLAIAHVGFGLWRLSANPTRFVEGTQLRLMQPAIAQIDKFNSEKEAQIIATYLDLSISHSLQGNGLDDVTHLIWPESSFPFLLTERRDVLAAIGEVLPENSTLITGALRAEKNVAGDPYGNVYNSVYVIGGNGEIEQAYDKVHLVPFGEYLPFQDTLESFGLQQLTGRRGGFRAGAKRMSLNGSSAGAFMALVCYEIIFPGQILPPAIEPRPFWLVNLTNDAWYGQTPGPYQHFRQAIVRGVEEGLPVVRVANNGISAVTDSFGRTIARLDLGERGVADSKLPLAAQPTPFSRFGNKVFFTLLVTLSGLWAAGRLSHRFSRDPA